MDAADTVASEEELMTENDMEAEARRLQAETRLLLAKRNLRDAKYPWLMFVPAIVLVWAKP